MPHIFCCRHYYHNIYSYIYRICTMFVTIIRFGKFIPTVKYGSYKVTPMNHVPKHIVGPCYSINNPIITQPSQNDPALQFAEVKSHSVIEKMRKAAKIASDCLELCCKKSLPGVTTDEIDKVAHEFIISKGAYPSGVNFHGFPKAICASPNEVVCHGIPDTRPLCNGDIISYDCTVYYDGVYGDCAKTISIGKPSDEDLRLIEATKECLMLAIYTLKPGMNLSEIGKIIHEKAKQLGYCVIKEFCGHFIGHEMHMRPLICHTYPNNTIGTAIVGQTFTIEPILCQGESVIEIWEDGWTAVTADRSKSAQFEHTVLVTSDGCVPITSWT